MRQENCLFFPPLHFVPKASSREARLLPGCQGGRAASKVCHPSVRAPGRGGGEAREREKRRRGRKKEAPLLLFPPPRQGGGGGAWWLCEAKRSGADGSIQPGCWPPPRRLWGPHNAHQLHSGARGGARRRRRRGPRPPGAAAATGESRTATVL